jgi:hypothetical protein
MKHKELKMVKRGPNGTWFGRSQGWVPMLGPKVRFQGWVLRFGPNVGSHGLVPKFGTKIESNPWDTRLSPQAGFQGRITASESVH